MKIDNIIEMWTQMVDMGIATDEEIGLAVALCGRTIQTLESVLYIRTGYHSLDQLNEADSEE